MIELLVGNVIARGDETVAWTFSRDQRYRPVGCSHPAGNCRHGTCVVTSTSEVGRILGEADIKPHRVKGWCHSSDPDFQAKMCTIVVLYVRRPAGAPVLSIDEKTGMQALSRARELQPAAPGRAGRLEFEYRRNGTRCLFACFKVATGRY
jgi:hypothetical protein